MASSKVRYLLFDVESVADGELLKKIEYPNESFTPQQAIDQCRIDRMEKTGREFIPYTYQIPVSIAIAKIGKDFSLLDLKTLDDDQYRPHIITRDFWSGWKHYREQSMFNGRPDLSLVSFNGRTFDVPLLELAAYRYGIDIGDWMNSKGPSYEQPRNRYNMASHLDLQEVITNFGATRLNGGLNMLANLINKPGKMGIAGHMVQDMYADGQIKEINDYCRCDVLDSYFVFLRTKVIFGEISLEEERSLVEQTKAWLGERSGEDKIFQQYLDCCEDWQDPWESELV